VHKAIKPENILLLTKSWAPPESQLPFVLGLPFLVGFYRCHPISDEFDNRYGETKLEDCLYQHPSRWGATAEQAFTIQDDIYSLGVVLLEIGLWQPFVWKNESRGVFQFSELFNEVTIMETEQRPRSLTTIIRYRARTPTGYDGPDIR
jgi:hypothetical protein